MSGRARPIRILAIAGTRPEAIKLAPLLLALRGAAGVEARFIATGQHRALFDAALAPFGVAPDAGLDVPNAGLDDFCAGVEAALRPHLAACAPDLVLVQGDTSSAWAAARAAAAQGLPVGHVEAGLRSGDPLLPWPEERNRREIDALSDLLFAPSASAAANLRGHAGEVHVTGNTGIDALRLVLPAWPPAPAAAAAGAPRTILVTCHRREAVPRLGGVVAGLRVLADRPDVRVLLPAHPNPAVRERLRAAAAGHPRLAVTEAMPYPAFLAALAGAHLLLTDSGGLQEEAPAFGVPTLVLRANSERPEAIACGSARLVGLDPDAIVTAAARLLDDPGAHAAMAVPAFPYGRGDASARILAAIRGWWARR